MTPPKVDIQSLDSLYLENLLGLDPNEAARRFSGTDLVLDTKTGELKKTGKDAASAEVTSIEQEAAWVKAIRDADANHDHYVDLDEVKKLLGGLPADQATTIDAEKFLKSIEKLIKERYNPLANNMKGWKTELTFKPTLEALELYNKGLLSEGYRHANSTFAFNGLTKTGANIVGFAPLTVRRIFSDKYVLWGDKLAMDSAKKDYEARTAVIGKLRDVIQKGVAANEAWALEGKLDEALKKLDPKDAALLNDQLAVTKLHGIINTPDAKERYTKMMEFLKKDRPGFLGFGTGNTSGGWFNDFWNYSGHRYNTFFSRTMAHFLASKAASGEAMADDAMHNEARLILKDMDGDGGDFNNLAMVGLTNVICLGGKTCEPTPYRDWSDENSMDALGRGVDGAIMVFGGNRFLTRFGEARKLRSLKGLFTAEGVYGTWKGAMAESKWNLLAGGKWGEAALAAEKEAETLGLAGKAAKDGRFAKLARLGEKWDAASKAVKEWIFKGVPLTAEQEAWLAQAKKVGKQGGDKLTRGFILYCIANYADSKLSPAFNPYDYKLEFGTVDREASFERYDDPTKADPTLNPAPKK